MHRSGSTAETVGQGQWQALLGRRGRWALSLVLAATALAAQAPEPASARQQRIASRAVTFQVLNTNRTPLACASDGLPYQVRGHLVGPRSQLSAARIRGVTLYLHGLGLGEWLWRFTAVPAYDYAGRQAGSGHVSLTIDQLGYGASDHPPGTQVCIGSQADIAHQVIEALRSGRYTAQGGAAPSFRRVALAGHSAAGEISNLEASTFRDVDALIVVGFSYTNLPRAGEDIGDQRYQCEQGGEPAGPGLPGGYAFFGLTPARFRSAMFHSARRSVVRAAVPLRNRDPCGANFSLIDAIAAQKQHGVGKIKVPTLVACGRNDALYAELGCRLQLDRYRRSRDRTAIIVRNAGHALPLERTASEFRKRISRWLKRRGL